MNLSMEFLVAVNTCEEGKQEAVDFNYLGMDYDEVIKDLVRRGKNDEAGWLISLKNSETFIRYGGTIVTMGAYQLYNPLTGLHTRYETEAEVKAAMVELANQILQIHHPMVNRELLNENGDAAWIPTELHKTLVVS